MSVKFTAIKCPECGANLDIEEGRRQMFCSYCGAKIIMSNENEYFIHHIDDTEVKKAEIERAVEMKELEALEKRRAAAEKAYKEKQKLMMLLVFFTIVSFLIGFSSHNGSGMGFLMAGMVCLLILMYMWKNDSSDERSVDAEEKIKVPSSISNYSEKNYATIESIFARAGFTNVRSVPLNDLTIGFLKKAGTVDSITINGNACFQKDMEKTCSTNTVRLWQTQDIKDLFIEENGQLFYIKPANYEISETRKFLT